MTHTLAERLRATDIEGVIATAGHVLELKSFADESQVFAA